MKNKLSLTLIYIGLIILLIQFLTGCQTTQPFSKPETGTYHPTEVFNPNKELAPKNFKSAEEFNDFVKKNAKTTDYTYYGLLNDRVSVTTMEAAIAEGTSAPKALGSEEQRSATHAPDHSETNIQVEGVDEADIIKTDGEYIYTISGNTVFIIKAYPGEEARTVSTIKFDNKPLSLFINNNYMAVFGNYEDLDFFKQIDFTPRQGMTYFNIYDISDRENPALIKEYKFEGRYFQARMIDDYVYFVTTTRPEYRKPHPTPVIIEGTAVRTIPVRNIYYYPIPYDSVHFVNIHAIRITEPNKDITSKTIAVEASQNMYMSKNNIYITYTKRINEYDLIRDITIDLMYDHLTQSDKELIEKIKNTDDDVLSQREKEAKILQIVQDYISYLSKEEQEDFYDRVEEELEKKLEEHPYMEYTVIHKINIDKDKISIDANGKVPGHIINQFSMDEHNSIFRIATTISPRWSRFEKQRTQSTNNVYTLDKNLRVLDGLEGIAEGEQIYSTRFIGDRLYMVTFKQTDPFFVIDLSNPRDIKELGKLKIPGFSRYLHPYDANTIIGIGREATATGRTQGLKISLFDVSNVENPEEIARFVTKERYAQSTAEYEHKAFLFSKDKELLVIPVYSQEPRCFGEHCPAEQVESYNGAMVFRITKDDIELRGIIDHSIARTPGKYYYGPLVERSLYIDDLLYTKSPTLLRINQIEDLRSVKNIELEGGESPYPIY